MTEAPATKPIRSFVAVPLPEEVRARVFAAAGELARALPGVRWTRKIENLHVTVKFLGPVEKNRLASFGAALTASFTTMPSFGIEVRGMGAFPSARRANVLWAGVVDPDGRLEAAATVIEATAVRLGICEPSNRPFRAHVTVGRSKEGVDARIALAALAGRSFGDAPVGEICVYESQLGGGPDNAGSTYVLRHTAALSGREPSKGSQTLPPRAPMGRAHLRSGDGSN
jgi:2'-5' RNA ligase